MDKYRGLKKSSVKRRLCENIKRVILIQTNKGALEMAKKKKIEVEEITEIKPKAKKVKADVMPVCPHCKSESIIVERQPIFKCLSCNNRFQ